MHFDKFISNERRKLILCQLSPQRELKDELNFIYYNCGEFSTDITTVLTAKATKATTTTNNNGSNSSNYFNSSDYLAFVCRTEPIKIRSARHTHTHTYKRILIIYCGTHISHHITIGFCFLQFAACAYIKVYSA